jgi:hypothetical protein
MNKYLFCLILLVCLIFASPLSGDSHISGAFVNDGLSLQVKTAGVLGKAFAAGACSEFDGADVAVWGRLPGRFLPKNRLMDLALKLAGDMCGRASGEAKSDTGSLANEVKYSEQFRQVRTAKITGALNGNIRLYLTVQSVKNSLVSGKEGAESYVLVKVWSEGKGANPGDRLIELTRIAVPPVMKICSASSITHSLWGSYGTVLTGKEKERIVKRFSAMLGCGQMKGGVTQGHVNMSGFSPKLANKVKIGKQSININIALRDDITHGVTRCILASPIIIDEY